VLRFPTPLEYIAVREAGDGTLRAALVGGRP
jgi:hypothetical protein